MRRNPCRKLSLRTSLERIAAESLTRVLSIFVHGDIWRRARLRLQDRVLDRIVAQEMRTNSVNAASFTVRLASQ